LTPEFEIRRQSPAPHDTMRWLDATRGLATLSLTYTCRVNIRRTTREEVQA
jgi:hypothetical protein